MSLLTTYFVISDDHKSKKSAKVVKEIETIDDEADKYNILIVKNDNFQAAQKYGIKKLPALMFFRGGSPVFYEGMCEHLSSYYMVAIYYIAIFF